MPQDSPLERQKCGQAYERLGQQISQYQAIVMSFISSPFSHSMLALLYLWLPLEGAEAFRLFSQPLSIPERGEVTSYALLTGNTRFSFLPPAGWQINANAEKREVTLLSHDQIVGISFKIVLDGAREKQDLDKWRQEVLRRYPSAKIVNESTCYSRDVQGVCFEFLRIASKKAKLSTRLAFVPFSDGTVEFLLTAPSEKSEDYTFIFANLLTSFHSERCSAPK
jgi:hypothetical protein